MSVDERHKIITNIEQLRLYIPDECPFCHHGIKPDFLIGYVFERELYTHYRIVFLCPRSECLEMFFSIYLRSSVDVFNQNPPYFKGSSPMKFKEEVFIDSVKEISKDFVVIYNQAKQAEIRGLDQICGLGYRKALEFLIKDYLIEVYPLQAEEIMNNHRFISIIEQFVTDEKVKFLAKRAAWLGNDQAHYTQLWNDKDVNDLKRLITTSLYWISAEKELEHYKQEMKEGRK